MGTITWEMTVLIKIHSKMNLSRFWESITEEVRIPEPEGNTRYRTGSNHKKTLSRQIFRTKFRNQISFNRILPINLVKKMVLLKLIWKQAQMLRFLVIMGITWWILSCKRLNLQTVGTLWSGATRIQVIIDPEESFRALWTTRWSISKQWKFLM